MTQGPGQIIVKHDGPLAHLTKPADLNATEHPNRSKFYNGNMPPEDLVRPLGAMICCQVLKDAEGRVTDAKLVMPDSAAQSWTTPVYVVTHVGPECKWLHRGDLATVPGNIQFQVQRIDGWEVLLCHEEQCLSTLPGKNVLGNAKDLEPARTVGLSDK